MRRGEIYAVDLKPVRGAAADRRRPAVIVTNDGANQAGRRLGRGVVTIVPLTSNVMRTYPFQVRLPAASTGLPRDSKAQAEQVRSVSVQRIGPLLGRVPDDLMRDLDRALRLHLAL